MGANAYRVQLPDKFVAIVIAIDMQHVAAVYPEATSIRRIDAQKVDIICPEKFGYDFIGF